MLAGILSNSSSSGLTVFSGQPTLRVLARLKHLLELFALCTERPQQLTGARKEPIDRTCEVECIVDHGTGGAR